MKTTKILLCASLMMVMSTAAHAKHYGAAGCGLGSVFFKDNGKVMQVIAATTNGSSYSQSFGISSGSSNCKSDGALAANQLVPVFVAANQQALSRDIARGSGETVVGLSAVLGCKDAAILGTELQKNFGTIFSTENMDSDHVTAAIRSTVARSTELKGSCSI